MYKHFMDQKILPLKLYQRIKSFLIVEVSLSNMQKIHVHHVALLDQIFVKNFQQIPLYRE